MLIRGSYRLAAVLLAFLGINILIVYFTQFQLDQGNKYIQELAAKTQIITSLQRQLKKTKTQLQNVTQLLNKKQAYTNNLPTIYMITPTYQRLTQKADLMRLCMTLMHVPKLHWLLVEDSEQQTRLVAKLLSGMESCKIEKSTQLNIRTPQEMRLKENEPRWRKNRGVEQRNLAIDWLREGWAKGSVDTRGVVYFGDDDNTYDPILFEEMRYTTSVSTWLVGITGGLRFEGPLCKDGHVTGWYAEWGTTRKFAIDMAGFAVNLSRLISNPSAYIDPKALRGNLESSLLEHLVTVEELEGKPPGCNKVMVWHTRTEKPSLKREDKLIQQGKPSNPHIET